MNVLLTTDVFPPGGGGSGRSTATLARALARRGHHVRVVVARRETKEQTEWNGVAVSEVAIPAARIGSRARETAYARGLERELGEEAWDLVHAQHWLSAIATRLAAPRLPMVVTVRDYWPSCIWSTMLSGTKACPGCSYTRRLVCAGRRRPWMWPLTPLVPPFIGAELQRRATLLAKARAVVAVSRHVARSLPGIADAEVIPNFSSELGTSFEKPTDLPDRYLLFIGKLEPNKAPDRLLPVLEAAKTEIPLIVAGSGSMTAELRRQAERRGRSVTWLGWVDEERTRALMQHADAVLFPSRWQEPLSRVLLDGLAVGAVLVVEPTGGSADLVVHEESGVLATGVDALGQELARVLTDEALAARLRQGALARAEAVFSEKAVLPQIEALYRGVTES
jgi:glycosyltransferase involved in cell wall biosynthesis